MEQTLRLELEAAHSRAEKAETEVKALREALKLAARPSKLQQFIVIAQDHPESLERRMLARSAHLDRAKGKEM